MIKKCEFCGSDFEFIGDTPNHRRKKYCSKECCIKSNNKKTNGKRKLVPLKQFFCSVCNKPYTTNRSDSKTCSLECRHERDKMLARRRYHLEVGISNKFLEEYKTEKKKAIKVPPAHEIEAEARKHGMNYGQYYALMLQKQEIEERERRKANEI